MRLKPRRIHRPSATLPALLTACSSLLFADAASAQTTDFQFARAAFQPFPTANHPSHIAAGDLNNDGQTDLVITGRNAEGVIYTALGQFAGGFGPFEPFSVDGQSDWVELRDFNADSMLDAAIVIRASDGRVAMAFGDGTGSFKEIVYIPVGREPRSLAALDFDSDDDLDLAVVNFSSADVTLLANDGRGSMSFHGRIQLNQYVGGLVFPQQILSSDFNADGLPDLAVTAVGAKRVDILLNQGGGVFGPERAYAPPFFEDVQGAVTNSAIGDMDGDNDPDVVTALIFGNLYQFFSVLPNDGTGRFTPASIALGALDGFAWSIALGDFEGDGDLDVVMGNAFPGWFSFTENTSVSQSLSFNEPQLVEGSNFLRDLLVIDLNGDCAKDVLALEFSTNSLVTLINQTPQQSGCGGLAGERAGTPRSRRPRTISMPELKGLDAAEIARILGELP